MKLPLRFGIPLLLALLAGLTAVDGLGRTVVLAAAMGVALWSALSLPRPPPPEEAENSLEQRLEIAEGEGMELNGEGMELNGEAPPPRDNNGAEPHPGERDFTETPDKGGTEERD